MVPDLVKKKPSSSLKFNAVSDWWDEYIAYVPLDTLFEPCLDFHNSYEALKKFIYQLEKQQAGREQILVADVESNERSSLLNQADISDTDAVFIPLLDRELQKIVTFYEHQEKELLEELEALEKDVVLQDELGLHVEDHWGDYADDDDEEDDESISRSPEGRRRKRSTSGRAASLSASLLFNAF